MVRDCQGLSPSLEISPSVIVLDNIPDYKNINWSTTFQRGTTYSQPHVDNGQSAMILPKWNNAIKIWFICDNPFDFEYYVKNARTYGMADSIDRIIVKSVIYLMKPGTYINVEGGRPHAVLTIFPNGSEDEPLMAFGYSGDKISKPFKVFVKGMNYKEE